MKDIFLEKKLGITKKIDSLKDLQIWTKSWKKTFHALCENLYGLNSLKAYSCVIIRFEWCLCKHKKAAKKDL